MKRSVFKRMVSHVLTFTLLLGFSACQKSVFTPETPVNPGQPDDPGVYEEGLYVTVKGSGLFTGEDWNNAMSAQDLKNLLLANSSGEFTAAQAAKINGKIIHLEQGIYPLGSASLPRPIISGKTAAFSVTIKGGYKNGGYTQYPDKYHTYLSGASDYQVFQLEGNVTLTMDGVGITGSRGEGGGRAAVILYGGTLNLSRATISNTYNSATTAGIQVNEATLNATECRFYNNVANFAGALNTGNATSVVNLNKCEFYNNACNEIGGAIKVTNGTFKATDCKFYNNHAEKRGGVLWINGCKDSKSVVFERCLFDGNSCTSGGGVCWLDGGASVTFKDCDFTNNFASNGSAGSLYLNEGSETDSWNTPNVMTVENCRFSGNNSVSYNGGSLHVRGSSYGNSTLNCTNCTFVGEYTTAQGGFMAMGGSGSPLATFNNCTISSCYAGKNSGLLYNYATTGKVYFNACTMENNHITGGSYGTEMVIGEANAFVGFNNCSVKGSFVKRVGANSQQCSWYNLNACKVLFSNSSLIGVPTSDTKELPTYGLVRLNHNAANVYFVNNIIVSTHEGGCSIFGGDTQTNLTVKGAYNYLSPVKSQKSGTFTYTQGTGDNLTSYASSFSGLKWGADGWMWDGSNAASAETSKVNNLIQTFDSGFYSWLNNIGALGKDIRGKDRGASSWPGSYQN